ncbi:MAG: MFS transporter [Asgard group archaeon]|nr:MFS transporter [Asgard group archaeon]
MVEVSLEKESIQQKSATEKEPSVREVLKNAPFMVLFGAQFTQNVAAAVSWLALTYFIYTLTDSPGLMGLLSVVYWLPYVLITPFAGVYVDRLDQRKIMLTANIISLIASIGYVLIYIFRESLIIHTLIITELSSGAVYILDIVNYAHVLWPLYLFTFLNSTAGAFFFPSRNAYTRLIVTKKNLLIANSIGSTIYQIATIIGYSLAGFIASISYLASFIFDASTFVLSLSLIILLLGIGQKPPERMLKKEETAQEKIKSVFDDLKIGFKTIQETPKVAYMLFLFAFAIFSFAAFNVLFIVILEGEMGLGTTMYGFMQSIMGISGIITSLIIMRIGRIDKKILMLNIVIAGLSVIIFFFAIVRNIWGIGVILFLLGIGLVLVNIPATTLIQESIPYEKQGRVFGTQQLIQGGSRLLGMGIVSLIAEAILPKYILIGSTGILTIALIGGFIFCIRNNLLGSDYAEKTSQQIATTIDT